MQGYLFISLYLSLVCFGGYEIVSINMFNASFSNVPLIYDLSVPNWYKLADTKGLIRSRKSQDKKIKMKRDNQWSTNKYTEN